MVAFQDTDIVMSRSHRVLHIYQKNAVHSWMLKVMAGSRNK